MRMKIHHPSASLSGTEITEKTLWKPKLRVLRVSVVNDFRRRMKIHHPSASLGAGSGTEITEKTLWKPRLRVLRVSVVNDFRRSTYQSRFPSSVILSAGRRGDRSRRTPIAAGLQNVAARHSNKLAVTCRHRGPLDCSG